MAYRARFAVITQGIVFLVLLSLCFCCWVVPLGTSVAPLCVLGEFVARRAPVRRASLAERRSGRNPVAIFADSAPWNGTRVGQALGYTSILLALVLPRYRIVEVELSCAPVARVFVTALVAIGHHAGLALVYALRACIGPVVARCTLVAFINV